MVYLSRIYTRKGDDGTTSLGDGEKRLKSDLRIQAIGDVDEANSIIGIARSHAPLTLNDLFTHIQNDLFDIGADLCIPTGDGLRIINEQIDYLELQIDHFNETLNPLTSFVLPAGQSCWLHHARTVVRRAERSVVALSSIEDINKNVLQYLNRLSDLLFVMARYVNNNGKDDVLWIPGKHRPSKEG